MGTTSRRTNFSLSRAINSSRKPIYIQVIALVGRMAHATAATAKASFLEPDGTAVEEARKQGQ